MCLKEGKEDKERGTWAETDETRWIPVIYTATLFIQSPPKHSFNRKKSLTKFRN